MAASGAKALYTAVGLIATYSNVDQSVQALEGLSKGLAGVLDSLARGLENPVLKHPKNSSYWTSVNDTVKACKTTIAELDEQLAPLQADTQNSGRKTQRAIRLYFHQGDIDRLVYNMKTHSINLQLALQTINVLITASVPGAISAEHARRFDRLERMLEEVRLHFEAQNTSSRPIAGQTGLRAITIDENTAQLYISAASVVSSGESSIIQNSSADTSQATLRYAASAFEDFTSFIRYGSFNGGSEAQSLDEDHRADIHSWVRHSSECDADFDEDYVFELTATIFAAGMKFYLQEEYGKAQENFEHGLSKATRLSDAKAEQLSVMKMQFYHALSCAAQCRLDEAETSILIVVSDPCYATKNTPLKCHAQSLLARIQFQIGHRGDNVGYIDNDKLELAEKSCGIAVRQMREEPLIGTAHASYIKALHLRGLILWATGNKIEARGCFDMVSGSSNFSDSEFDEMVDNEVETFGSSILFYETAIHLDGNLRPAEAPRTRGAASLVSPLIPRKQIPQSIDSLSGDSSNEFTSSLGKQLYTQDTKASISTSRSTREAYEMIKKKGFEKRSQSAKGMAWAAKQGNVDVLDTLMSLHLHENLVDEPEKGIFRIKDSPLSIAAANGHYKICQRLLTANAKVNFMPNNQTALDYAIEFGHIEICQLLLDYGATSDCQEGQEITPLARAINGKRSDISSLLAKYSSDINEPRFYLTKKKRSVLMQAAAHNNSEAIRWLIDDLKAEVDGPDPKFTTPLIEAARANAFKACRVLLERGAKRHNEGVDAAKAATGWLRGFISEWPESKNETPPKYSPSLQP